MRIFKYTYILIIIIYISCSENQYQIAFDKMKDNFKYPNDKSSDFESLFYNILKTDPIHTKTLLNLSYYLLSRHDSVSLNKCYKYIGSLIKQDPNHPLFLLLEFKLYEKIVNERVIHGNNFESYFKIKIIDTFLSKANTLSNNFSDIYFIRLNVLPYLEYRNFEEMEDYLIESLNYKDDSTYNSKISKYLDGFIEYDTEGDFGFGNITQYRDHNIEHYLHNYYTGKKVQGSIIRQYYKLNEIEVKKPRIKEYPIKYQKYLYRYSKVKA